MKHYSLTDDLLDQWIYATDDSGKIIKEERRNPDGKLRSVWRYQYNDQEQLIRKDIYSIHDKLLSYMEMTYDDSGYEKTFGLYRADGREKWKYQWHRQCKEE